MQELQVSAYTEIWSGDVNRQVISSMLRHMAVVLKNFPYFSED